MSDTKYKTLEEHNVKAGDVVEYSLGGRYTVKDHYTLYGHRTGIDTIYVDYNGGWDTGLFKVISRANKQEYKTFGEMTPEEKGALLLAHHEGKVIQVLSDIYVWFVITEPFWDHDAKYRVKPEVKTVTSYTDNVDTGHWYGSTDRCPSDTHKITYNIVDGKVDCNSIKMEEL